jgi:hypothetical protein
VPKKDCPEFGWTLCFGSTEQLKAYQQRFSHRMFDSQLLIQTGVEPKVPDQNNTVEKTTVVETGVDWLERGPLGLWLWPDNANSVSVDTLRKNNELLTINELKKECQSLGDSTRQVHVDDISELCLDVLVGINEQESDTSTQQILEGCIDRFSQRTRPLYN